jgi:hypothetical protein
MFANILSQLRFINRNVCIKLHTLFHFMKKPGKPPVLRDLQGTGYRLSGNPVWLHAEPSRFDLTGLIFGGLADCGDTGTDKAARHGTFC